jgi:hypothetical protein
MDSDVTSRDGELVALAALHLIRLDPNGRFEFIELIKEATGSCVLSRSHRHEAKESKDVEYR